jgi:hypothetical protein
MAIRRSRTVQHRPLARQLLVAARTSRQRQVVAVTDIREHTPTRSFTVTNAIVEVEF